MKMTVALLPALSLALSLSACAHKKSSHKSGGGDQANAEDVEPASEDEGKNVEKKPATPVKKSGEGSKEPQAGAGEDDQPKDELCYKTDEKTCQIEQRILELLNKERAAPTKGGGLFGGGGNGAKAALLNGKKLAFVARAWSVVQGQRNSIGHDGFPNSRGKVFQQEFQSNPSLGGENVAMFGGGAESVEDVAQTFYKMWYESSGHYQNMMGNFQAVGVGVAKVNGSWWATQIFGRE